MFKHETGDDLLVLGRPIVVYADEKNIGFSRECRPCAGCESITRAMYSFSFSRAGCWQSGAGDFMLHEHAFPLRINLFSFSIWACWQWHHYGHAVQLHQTGVLLLLEVESVSTRSRVCFYSKQSLFLLESESSSTLRILRFHSKRNMVPHQTCNASGGTML